MAAALVANDRIAAEEFAGEVVLIDIEQGIYFSLQGAAVDLWRAFAAPRSPAAVLDLFADHGADRPALSTALDDLRRHDLVRETAAPPQADLSCSAPVGGFGAPVVSAFSDLAELIAIDPVHEVDAAAGWPLRPATFPDVS